MPESKVFFLLCYDRRIISLKCIDCVAYEWHGLISDSLDVRIISDAIPFDLIVE